MIRGKWSKHLLLVPVLLLGILPFLMMPEISDMPGSDSRAEEAIIRDAPHYKPWFKPLWVPPGSEMESLLFSLQSALGGLALGYILGRLHRIKRRDEES